MGKGSHKILCKPLTSCKRLVLPYKISHKYAIASPLYPCNVFLIKCTRPKCLIWIPWALCWLDTPGSFRNPPPGQPRDQPPSNSAQGLGQKVTDLHDPVARENFRVVLICPEEVEQLDLTNQENIKKWNWKVSGNVEDTGAQWKELEVWPWFIIRWSEAMNISIPKQFHPHVSIGRSIHSMDLICLKLINVGLFELYPWRQQWHATIGSLLIPSFESTSTLSPLMKMFY